MKAFYKNIALWFRQFVGNNTFLFYSFYGFKVNHPVKKSCKMCIEGYMSSANTFFAYAFYKENNVKIGHHQHVVAQVRRALKNEIPTVIMLRKPLDAVASIKSRKSFYNVDLLLKYYINLYSKI